MQSYFLVARLGVGGETVACGVEAEVERCIRRAQFDIARAMAARATLVRFLIRVELEVSSLHSS